MVNKARRLSGINTLAYLGIDPLTAPYLVVDTRIPTSDDRVGNQIGALWVLEETDTVTARFFVLVRLQGAGSGGATWFEIGSGGGGFVNTFVTDSGSAMPIANIINVIGGTSVGGVATNINTRGSGNTVFVDLNNSIFQPDTNSTGTQGMYSLGGATFLHNFGTHNTWVGEEAGNLTLTTGQDNVGVGYHASEGITTGNDNIAIGSNALNAQAGGSRSIAIGSNALSVTNGSGNDIAIGFNAGVALNGVGENVIVGSNGMNQSTTSSQCVAIGYNAMSGGTTDSQSTIAIGWNALANNTPTDHSASVGIGYLAVSGGGNLNTSVAIGHRVMEAAVGQTNISVVIGRESSRLLDTGSQLVIIGCDTFRNATTGHVGDVGIGYGVLDNATTSSGITDANSAVGYLALNGITTGGRNCALGVNAATRLAGASSDNIAIGSSALNSAAVVSRMIGIGTTALSSVATGGADNVAVGNASSQNMTTGSFNQSFGSYTLRAETTGQDNTAIGYNACNAQIGASHNVAIGNDVLILNTTGSQNTAVGSQSMNLMLTGSYNTSLGYLAGDQFTGSESNNITIGSFGTAGDNNTIRIGMSGAGIQQQNKCFVAGIRGITTGNADAIAVLIDSAGQLGTVSSSARFKDNIQDMGDASSDVMKLRPVTFTYKQDEEQRLQYGLIAEEVEEVMPRLVAHDEHGEIYTVRYNELPAILLNEIQKLEKRISSLESRSCACSH